MYNKFYILKESSVKSYSIIVFLFSTVILKKNNQGGNMKYLLYIVVTAIVCGLLIGGVHLFRVSQKNKKEMAQYDGPQVSLNKKLGKVLVVYYSLSGHTKQIAEIIKQETNADIYEIKTLEKLDTVPWFYMTLREQLKDKTYPEIQKDFPDFSQYDMIFVGAPVWWYTMATPLYSFLQQVDFGGKKVVPFSTQGSNFGTYFEDFAAQAKNADIQLSQSFNNLPEKYREEEHNKIIQWLNQL